MYPQYRPNQTVDWEGMIEQAVSNIKGRPYLLYEETFKQPSVSMNIPADHPLWRMFKEQGPVLKLYGTLIEGINPFTGQIIACVEFADYGPPILIEARLLQPVEE